MIERNNLAVDDGIRKFRSLLGNRGKFLGPVETLAGSQRDVAVFDPHLDPIAVELDLVHPVAAGGRIFDRCAQLRLDEIGKFLSARFGFCVSGGRLFSCG